MTSELMKIGRTVAVFFLLAMLSISAASAMEYSGPANLEAQLSSDGKTMYNAVPAVVYRVDPNPPKGQARIPARFDMATLPETASSTFSITYAADGSTDPWGKSCVTFPEEAKAAFNAAAAIWGNLLNSSVPITISACWSDLGSPSILGYSGGGNIYRDFTNAPRANTWYASSLANALAGSDLGPTSFDMYITYNSGFAWYYGTDGVTPAGQYDLMSVVLHEIAHGLNFSGSMSYSGGSGSWGGGTGYPNIYDTFMRDGTANPGNLLIDTGVYANPSTGLGSALTSNNIWFHGANAMTANGGQRVKMYAPSTWAGGSSYSHLDYSTFAGTANRLMVYAISSGVSTHDPGPITLGIFKDMGWPDSIADVPTVTTTTPSSGATGVAVSTTITATFSKAMDASTITTSTFYLNNGVTGTVSYDTASRTATFTPAGNLALSTTYTVTITTGVTDASGSHMAANKTWSFTTTDGNTPVNPIVNGDFESADGWQYSQPTGATAEWGLTSSGSNPSASPHGGSYMAIFNSYVANSGDQALLYQSNSFAIPSTAGTVTLKFWMYHDTGYSDRADKVRPYVSTDGGNNFTAVGSDVPRYDGTTGWSQVTVDLSSYKGQSSVVIGFLGTSGYGNDMYLDDASVVGLGGSYSVSGTIRLNGTGLSGVTVSTGSATGTTNGNGVYLISGLSNGSYTVTPTLSPYTFSPASSPVTVSGANVTGVNFLASAAVQRNLSVSITGNGSVNSDPTGIACTTGNSGYCSHQFNNGLTVTLTPSAESDSIFNSWTGCTSLSGNNCLISMTADKSATATFIVSPAVRIPGVGGYSSLQEAYNVAPTSGTIQARAIVLSASPLTLNLGKNILLEGGYDGSYNSNNGGYTTMQGILTLGTGFLTLENLIIK